MVQGELDFYTRVPNILLNIYEKLKERNQIQERIATALEKIAENTSKSEV